MFNRRLLIDSGGKPQTYSALEIHVDTPDGDTFGQQEWS